MSPTSESLTGGQLLASNSGKPTPHRAGFSLVCRSTKNMQQHRPRPSPANPRPRELWRGDHHHNTQLPVLSASDTDPQDSHKSSNINEPGLGLRWYGPEPSTKALCRTFTAVKDFAPES